jgi:hypothetical protein
MSIAAWLLSAELRGGFEACRRGRRRAGREIAARRRSWWRAGENMDGKNLKDVMGGENEKEEKRT